METLNISKRGLLKGTSTVKDDALDLAGLDPLYVRRIDSCKSFVIKAKEVLRVFYSPTVVEHDRNLRSGNKTVHPNLGRTARLDNFVTVKYQC